MDLVRVLQSKGGTSQNTPWITLQRVSVLIGAEDSMPSPDSTIHNPDARLLTVRNRSTAIPIIVAVQIG